MKKLGNAKRPDDNKRILLGDRKMENINQLTIDDLENLIEQKILEILGDPDTSLDLKEEFKEELKARLARRLGRIPHEEVMERFGCGYPPILKVLLLKR